MDRSYRTGRPVPRDSSRGEEIGPRAKPARAGARAGRCVVLVGQAFVPASKAGRAGRNACPPWFSVPVAVAAAAATATATAAVAAAAATAPAVAAAATATAAAA